MVVWHPQETPVKNFERILKEIKIGCKNSEKVIIDKRVCIFGEKDMAKQYWRPGNMLYPVPAVMVSCQRPGEKPNIITIAWAGTVCSSPAMVSISVRKERHSYDILKETREFVINLVTKDLVRAADYCGVRSGRDVDKFQEMHLTELPSQTISAPGITESPVNIECKVTEVKELGSHDLFLELVE